MVVEVCESLKGLLGIEFEYADEQESGRDTRITLNPETVTLPADLWQELKDAADRYSMTGLKRAIGPMDQGDDQQKQVATYLRQLINEGDLDLVSEFLDQVKKG